MVVAGARPVRGDSRCSASPANCFRLLLAWLIPQAMPTNGGLMKFVAVTARCIGCKASLASGKDAGASALCSMCKPREVELYYAKLQTYTKCERLFWQ